MLETFYWVSIVVAWLFTVWNLWDMRRRRRPDLSQIAKDTGLSKLQVQVAVDDAVASFYQRIGQLTPTKKEDNA